MTVALAITGSQRMVGVGVQGRDGSVAVRDAHDPPRDRDWLWPAIASACAEVGVGPSDLECVGVDTGPGGFSGLRTTIAAAQSIALAREVPVVPIPGAVVAAWSTQPNGAAERAHVLLSAKGDSVWESVLEWSGGTWCEVRSGITMLCDWQVPRAAIVVADHHLPESARSACMAAGVVIHEPRWSAAGALRATLALHAAGVGEEPSRVSPEYAREPEAVALWRRRHPE